MPLNYKCSKYRYDVPMGTADRDPADMDLPANSFAVALNENGRSLMLVSDSKHGFRGVDDSLSLTLIRSSFDPDPWPEVGEHTIRMGISLVDTANAIDQIKDASKYCHPMSLVSAKPTPGTMPMEGSLIKSIEGCGVLSSVKMAENKDDGVIIRLYDGAGMGGMTSIEFARDIKEAKVLSLLEEGTLSPANIDGNKVNVEIKRSSMATLKVNFNCSV